MESLPKRSLKYAPLGHREFRILLIEPGDESAPINCQLLKQKLDHIKVDYFALSYTWGDVSKTKGILCVADDKIALHMKSEPTEAGDVEIGELQISMNLLAALRNARQTDQVAIMWVDAICIDQENIEERNQQVLVMWEIYIRASQTIIYLGESSEFSDDGFSLIEDLYSARQPNGTQVIFKDLSEAMTRHHWQGLYDILLRPWFKRIWVRQELAMSRNPVIVCGTRGVSWEKFKTVVPGLLMTQHGFTDKTEPKYGIHHTKNLLMLCKLVMSHTTNHILDKELLFLLYINRECEATDPRDKVLAILGLCSPTQQSILPKLDYSQSPKTIFLNVAVTSILMFKSLNILSHAGSGYSRASNCSSLPSWVPDWSLQWDSSVIDAPLNTHQYRAAGNTKPTIEFSAKRQSLIKLGGKKIDTVSDLAELTPQFDHLFGSHKNNLFNVDDLQFAIFNWSEKLESLRLKCEKKSNKIASSEVLWRTLCANKPSPSNYNGVWQDLRIIEQDKQIKLAPEAYTKSFEAWCKVNMNDPNHVANTHSVDLFLLGENLKPWQESMVRAARNRRFGITQSGYMFLAPGDTRLGDVLCVLYGGDIPFILRPTKKGRYQLIGECYVHHLMNGEAITNDKIMTQDFLIE